MCFILIIFDPLFFSKCDFVVHLFTDIFLSFTLPHKHLNSSGILGILLKNPSESEDHSLNSTIMPRCENDYISITCDPRSEDSKSERIRSEWDLSKNIGISIYKDWGPLLFPCNLRGYYTFLKYRKHLFSIMAPSS